MNKIPTPLSITASERALYVLQANANQAIEDFYPDESDKKLQAQYVIGTATLDDLLNHAREFAGHASMRHSS